MDNVYMDSFFGSTPLARGTPIPHLLSLISVRFNPACAGNSLLIKGRIKAESVQPRLRGELIILGVALRENLGSTPLARGTQKAGAGTERKYRFNPACAGNSNSAKQQREMMAVQPRLRGEL